MNHLTCALWFGVVCLLFTPQARSQTPPEEAPAGDQEAIASAQKEWLEALAERPGLVSLGEPPDFTAAGSRLPELLQERLRLLGRKVFSNRAWRAYWERQQALAKRLAELYRGQAAGAAKADAKSSTFKAEGLAMWAAMANSKVKNQDVYMKALGTERDAIEDRRVKLLDQQAAAAVEAKQAPPTPRSADPSPYELRERRILELRERIDFQLERRAIAQMELKLIERQTESIGLMDAALREDVELARRELEIATAQTKSEDRRWVTIWRPFAAGAAAKAKKIEEELALGDQRRRSLLVEVELAQAQIKYRDNKRQELQEDLAAAASYETLLSATWATTVDFLKDRAWKLAVVLLLIYIALKLALRLIKMGTNALLRAVDDQDPDYVSLAEKRAETIKTVFAPVLRVAVYAIAVLVVLDQIGVDIAPLLGSVAILGLAISFGSQNLVRDLVNGFFILIENQFSVGDVVEIGGSAGVVENVNVRSTRLRQLDGTLRIIPNGEITNVANRTREWSRAVVHCGVAYGTDMAAVSDLVNQIGAEMYAEEDWHEKLLEAPAYVGVTELGDSAVVFRCMVKTQPGAHWEAERELNRRLHQVLGDKSIEIPFPQRVVWHKND